MLKKIISNKNFLFVAAGIIAGILLIVAGSIGKDDKKAEPEITEQKYTSDELESYTDTLEKKIAGLISKIGGVSDVSVLVTVDGSNETIFATEGTDNEFVIIKDSDGNEYVVRVSEINAQVRGIAVVCDYGGNDQLKMDIINLLSSLFAVGANRISVMQA